MQQAFDSAVVHATEFLKSLPRMREDVRSANERLNQFRSDHPEVRADLLIDQPPGSTEVDYDLLLGESDNGTLALSWRADNADPWVVKYTEHWAANFVVTVNGHNVKVQDVLLLLKIIGQRDNRLLDDIVDQALLFQALQEDPIEISDEEAQSAADRFRIRSGLRSAEATRRWMKEMGLTADRFRDLASSEVRIEKLINKVSADRVESYFAQHRDQFDQVLVFEICGMDNETAGRVVERGRVDGLLSAAQGLLPDAANEHLRGELHACTAQDLPAEARDGAEGSVIGPFARRNVWCALQVIRRSPAELNASTRTAIREQLFRDWLNSRCQQAAVRWHWM
ncbi:MAG: hypothetical protein DMG15_16100 [Acidobacteria bacterium]|nr:MAG: hypothetical protein DMG15_16100 [Acidobacteriota bacterium]